MGVSILRQLTDISLYLSLSSTTLVIIYFLLKPKKRLSTIGQRLIFSIMCSGVIYSVGFIVNNLTFKYTCPIVALVFLYGVVGVGTCTCAIAVHIYCVAKMKRSPRELYFHLVGWGVPLLWAIIPYSAGVIGIQETGYCFVATKYLYYVAYLPLALCFVINTTLLGMTIYVLKRYNITLSAGQSSTSSMQRKLFLLQINYSLYVIASLVSSIVLDKYTYWVALSSLIGGIQPFVNVLITQSGRIKKAVKSLGGVLSRMSSSSSGGTSTQVSTERSVCKIQMGLIAQPSDSSLPSPREGDEERAIIL